jgi:hypothetical protein
MNGQQHLSAVWTTTPAPCVSRNGRAEHVQLSSTPTLPRVCSQGERSGISSFDSRPAIGPSGAVTSTLS